MPCNVLARSTPWQTLIVTTTTTTIIIITCTTFFLKRSGVLVKTRSRSANGTYGDEDVCSVVALVCFVTEWNLNGFGLVSFCSAISKGKVTG